MAYIVKSQFKPMTYDSIAKPLIELTEYQSALEELYLDAYDKATKLKALANELTDPEAYNKLNNYANTLKAQADLLAANGLSANSRSILNSLRLLYSNDIYPYERAAEIRDAFLKEQRDALNKDLTLKFDNNFNDISLSQIVKNPNMSYRALSGNLIALETESMAKNYANLITTDPKYSKILGEQYWLSRILYGYTPELIVLEAMGDPNAPLELRAIRNTIHQSLLLHPSYNKEWVDSYINKGMTAAIGKTSQDIRLNLDYIDEYELERLKLEKDRLQFDVDRLNQTYYNPNKPENYSEIEGTNGLYVLNNKTGYVFNKLTGEVVAKSIKEFRDYISGRISIDKVEAILKNPIYFKDNIFKNTEINSYNADEGAANFNVNDATLYPKSKLTNILKQYIISKLPLGVTLDDIDIYVDTDGWLRSDFKVVPKGYNVVGELDLDFE